MNFWAYLPKPIVVLAPMANVTDASFRRMFAKYSKHVRRDGTEGGPDVMWTEFVSADGLVKADAEGKQKLMADLLYTEAERPIVAQLFTAQPEHMRSAVRLCKELGFDGVDINMGCPDKTIEKQGCGATMIKNPQNAIAVLRAAMEEAGDMPVSVKTRVGYNKVEIDTWIASLLQEGPAALTVHARTRKEMSKVPARWEHLKEVVALRDAIQTETWVTNSVYKTRTRIIGNGDVQSLNDAYVKIEESGADGAMVGRGIFGNPWFFHPEKSVTDIPLAEKLQVLVEHTKLFATLLPFKNFALMKKHYKAYVSGFDGAKELRVALMETENADEVAKVVNTFLQTYSS